jgi:hypothetical protein
MRDTMNTRIKRIPTIVLLTMMLALINMAVFSQENQSHHPKTEIINGKKGEIHLTENVRVGTIIVKPGMYQVQHVMEGSDHVVVFKEVGMQAGYRHGNTPIGKEVARANCKVEPVAKSAKNTKITLRHNAVGEKEIVDVQVAGDKFKCVL